MGDLLRDPGGDGGPGVTNAGHGGLGCVDRGIPCGGEERGPADGGQGHDCERQQGECPSCGAGVCVHAGHDRCSVHGLASVGWVNVRAGLRRARRLWNHHGMPSNEEKIRELSKRTRDSKGIWIGNLEERNEAMKRQRAEERTPHTVIAEWSGLTEQQVRRICRDG